MLKSKCHSGFIRVLAAGWLCAGLAACQTPVVQTWPTPAGATTSVVNGYPLTYSVRGTGPTVVFLPGVLVDYRSWQQSLQSWEADYRVVAVSPRHFFPEKWDGKGRDFTVQQQARDIDALIERLGGPVYLVGWSYGGALAYEAARARPDLVKKLVLVEPALGTLVAPADPAAVASLKAQADSIAKQLDSGETDSLQRVIDTINGPGAWAAASEMTHTMFRDNAWTIVGVMREDPSTVTCAQFGALPMPVLLVHGEKTTPRFLSIVGEASKCLPSASTATIPKAGHPSPLINPAAFKDVTTAFLRQ